MARPPCSVVAVSTAWEPRRLEWQPFEAPGLAGTRLEELGASYVPARRVLLARLAPAAPPADCKHPERWSFYTNTTLLQRCGFLNAPSSSPQSVYLEIIYHVSTDTEL